LNLRQFSPYKILYHIPTILEILSGKNPFPVSCEIDPSNYCNHSCEWCYFVESRESHLTSIPREILLRVVEELAKGGTKAITFTGGGEPLLNEATLPAIEKASAHGIKIGLVSNGALLDKEKCEFVVKHCSFVRFSVDAGSSKTFEAVHRPKNPKTDNFDKIMQNLSYLVEAKKRIEKEMPIGIGFVVHPKNYEEIYLAAELFKKIGADYFQLRPVFSPDNTLSMTEVWLKAAEFIDKSLNLNDTSYQVLPIQRRFDEIMGAKRRYSQCLIHSLLAVVGADARLYLCSIFRGSDKFVLGDLRKESFEKIWNGERRNLAIQSIDVNKCPACRYAVYNEIMDYLDEGKILKEQFHVDFL